MNVTTPLHDGMVMRAVTRAYSGGVGVDDLSFDVAPGEVHALVGVNGAGKSTLMKLLLGMLRPASGAVSLAGRELAELPLPAWSRVGQLVGAPLSYPELTVTGNLLVNAALRGVTAPHRNALVDAAIERFGLRPFRRRRARVLSSGNLQRLGLAAALQHHPDFIVLDEPTNALDPAGTILLRDVLRERAASGAAVLISSHHLDEVARVADRITVMNAGRLIGALDPAAPELERAFFALVLRDDETREASPEER